MSTTTDDKRPLSILAPTRYPWRFNSPRQSRHHISIRNFLPLNKISPKIEGITIFNPLPPRRFDLIHAFNRIPLGITPFIIGFESHLPRAFMLEDTAYFRALVQMLTSNRCKGIIAISQYARYQFLKQHTDRPWHNALAEKLTVRYPNIPIPNGADAFNFTPDAPVKIVFVGNHFARKGGTVALRLAEIARQNQFPLELDIVSRLEVGNVSWTDPRRQDYFTKDLELLYSLPNVKYHGTLPNDQVLSLVKNAHFTILTTFSDSFGFSAIEAMANYTPVIASMQGALPEFITDGINGIAISMENTAAGEWKHIGRHDRNSHEYEMIFDNEVNRMAMEAYKKLEATMHSPSYYLSLRSNARATAEKLFSATDANAFWDNYYTVRASKVDDS